MSDSFDPYRVWLGIPPEARPPTHYQLLGISPNEHEQAVIEAAVLRQSGYVRNFQIGKYAKDAARILNEIAAAKACLLDPAKRAKYDAEVAASQPTVAPARHPIVRHDPLTSAAGFAALVRPPMPLSDDILSASVGAAQPVPATHLVRRSLRGATLKKPSHAPWQPLAAFGIGVALTLVAVAVWPRRAADERGEPNFLVGTVSLDAPSPTPSPARSTALHVNAPTVISTTLDVPTPQVLQIKTSTYSWPGLARHEDDGFYVGTGSDFGSSAVGYQLKGVRKVGVQISSIGTLRPMDGNFFAGFLVDYHTPTGYFPRVALCVGHFTDKWRDTVPDWGGHVAASQFIDLTREFTFNEQEYLEKHPDVAAAVNRRELADGQHHWEIFGKYAGYGGRFGTREVQELDLEEWAPHDWDGNAWFAIAISNAGSGAHIEGRLIDPAPPSIEKSPGEFRRLTGHTDSVTALAFLPNGRLLSGSFDTTWAVWDAGNGIAAQRFPTELYNETTVRAVAVSSGDHSALPSSAIISNVNRIDHFDVLSGKLLHRLYGASGLRCLAMSADAHFAVSGSEDGHRVRLWDLKSGQQVWDTGFLSWPYSVALSPDGIAVFVGFLAENLAGKVHVYDTAGRQTKTIDPEMAGGIIGISPSPDGKRLLLGSEYAPVVKLWSLESGTELAHFEAAPGGGNKPVFSPDGKYGAWGGGGELVSVWDLENQSIVAQFEHPPLGFSKRRRHGHDWMPVAFSPDGNLLASGADDGTICLWNLPAAEEAEETENAPRNSEPSAHGQFTPLDLSRAATIITTQGMFHSKSSGERIVFDDWSPKTFEGVPFELVDPQGDRVPNAIMLYGPNGAVPPTMPLSVKLACGAPARAIHFLSGVSGWGAQREIKGGSVSIIVRLQYAGGATEDHPLRNGEHFADVFGRFDVPKSKPAFNLGDKQLRYFPIYPKRREPIEQIELLKGPDYTAPIVMAITVEGP